MGIPVAMTSSDVAQTGAIRDEGGVARALAVVALAVGSVWLVFRVLATRDGVPFWFWLPLWLIELGIVIRLALFASVTWRLPEPIRPTVRTARTVDVLVSTYHEPTDLVRATLLGCAEMTYPHRTYVVDDANRPDIRALAAELGVGYLTRAQAAQGRSGAVSSALERTNGEYALLLDADQVPMPDLLHAVMGHFADERVAFVQTPLEFLNRDSILHSSPDRHERQLHNEVIAPGRSAAGAAIWEGSASVIRRSAIADIGGIVSSATTYDYRTTIRWLATGHRGVFHPEVLVQGVAPHNLDLFLSQRGRWARGRIATVWTPDSPLRSRGLSLRQRAALLQPTFEDLQGWSRLAAGAIVVCSLLTGVAPLDVEVGAVIALFVPWAILGSMATHQLARGRLVRREVIRRDLTLLQLQLSATFAAIRGDRRRFRPVARTGQDRGGLDVIDRLRFLTVVTVVLEVALILRMADALVGWPLRGMRGAHLVLAITAGLWILWNALGVLGVFVRRRQHRAAYRIEVDLPAFADGDLVRVRDLTAAGAAFVSTRSRRPGDVVDLVIRMPDIHGRPHDIRTRATVRSVVANQTSTRWRTGAAFEPLTPIDRDTVLRYCAVIRPFQQLRSAHRPIYG
ncbi:MAG: glycosyltransferase [Actinomycetota bacterium]